MPGGAVSALSARSAAELIRRVPCLPIDQFKRLVAMYRIERRHNQLSPADARDELKLLSSRAADLAASLDDAMQDEALLDLLGKECTAFGDFELPFRVHKDVLRLAGIADHACNEAASHAKRGRDFEPRTRLIHSLAAAIEQGGEKADSRANGPLALAFSIAMSETDEALADIKGTIRSALASYQGGE